MSDAPTAGQIGIALRRMCTLKRFADELNKLTGYEGSIVIGERSTMNRHENITDLTIDGVLYRVTITKLDR